jgi:hypothetical protein
MNGTGTLTLANGAKYHGSWKADKRCGHGVYALMAVTHRQNVTLCCSYTLANGDTYDGEWANDRKNGKGM